MPTFSAEQTYQDGTVPTENQLDTLKESIEYFFNATRLDDDNISTAAITSSKIMSTSIYSSNIASAAVTNIKKSDLNIQSSSLIGPATNTSVDITTTGRPVLVVVCPLFGCTESFSTGPFDVGRISGAGANQSFVQINKAISGGALKIPVGAAGIRFDIPPAGTHTYAINTHSGNFTNVALHVMEL